ncbi:MAG: 50S ribosomal protein L6 [Deltaproteobacteria bacterium RBG_13_43_22]|nr:MAG: 50S ribosomal protein L6 [Deltaproteobacteria bacterium RBG_13_43_22]
MSRVGKKPIPIPDTVKVVLTDEGVKVQGPKGELKRSLPPQLAITVEGNQVLIHPREDSQKVKALFGLFRTLVANMVKGVAEGFERVLEIQGVGYRAEVQGSQLVLSLGYSHPVPFQLPEGISAQVERQTRVILSGIDRDLLGLTAARIRRFRPPEPYKGKGIKYQEEKIRRKVGKTGSK